MKALLQRVDRAAVHVEAQEVARIGRDIVCRVGARELVQGERLLRYDLSGDQMRV